MDVIVIPTSDPVLWAGDPRQCIWYIYTCIIRQVGLYFNLVTCVQPLSGCRCTATVVVLCTVMWTLIRAIP